MNAGINADEDTAPAAGSNPAETGACNADRTC